MHNPNHKSATLNIENMLPHRKPMLMMTEVISCDASRLHARSDIDVHNPLLENGRFPGYASLELLAQASGLFLALNMGGDAKPGAIVSVRHMHIEQAWLDIDDDLHIETEFLGGSGSAAMFSGYVSQAQTRIMQATLTISQFNPV